MALMLAETTCSVLISCEWTVTQSQTAVQASSHHILSTVTFPLSVGAARPASHAVDQWMEISHPLTWRRFRRLRETRVGLKRCDILESMETSTSLQSHRHMQTDLHVATRHSNMNTRWALVELPVHIKNDSRAMMSSLMTVTAQTQIFRPQYQSRPVVEFRQEELVPERNGQ